MLSIPHRVECSLLVSAGGWLNLDYKRATNGVQSTLADICGGGVNWKCLASFKGRMN